MTPQALTTTPPKRMETPAERRARKAAYQAARRTHSFLLTFRDEEELGRFRALGAEAGYSSLNAYLVQLLHYALSGSVFPPEYVEGLKREVDKLRAWVEQAREECAEYRADVRGLTNQRDTLLRIMHDLPDGPEAAARFLAQQQQQPPQAMAKGVRA